MAGKTWPSVRQDQTTVVGEFEPRRPYHLPAMAVGIGEIAAIAAVVGPAGLPHQLGACRERRIERAIDLFRRPAVPGKRRAAKRLGSRLVRFGGIVGEL